MATKRLNAHLSKKELNVLRTIMLDETKRLEASFTEKKEYEAGTSDHKDEVDSANDQIQLESSMRFSKRDTFYYKKLNKALKFIETEEYGMCNDCGEPISFTRLRARPTSEMCITCKEESEREENQNFHMRKSKSLGQEMSFAR